MEFLATRAEPGDYDAEIARLGSRVITCPTPSAPVRFAVRLHRVLRGQGPYHAVHSHVHHFSGLVLAVARLAGVPVRVAHSHTDSAPVDAGARPLRRAYLAAMKGALRRFATHGLAVSHAAAGALFGPGWRDDHRIEVARCGLDFSVFRGPADAAAVRAELGIPEGALVLGHVGRFDAFKNQGLLVPALAAAARRDPRAFLVLVGDGPLRPRVEAEAARLGVRDRVRFTGLRADVPRVLRAFDVFVFPSLHEGLPLVGLEAQAAGLPIVLSDRVTRELAVIPELFTWISPGAPADRWAEAALEAARGRAGAGDPVAALERSDFSLSRSVAGLLAVYGAR
jgi:glycosyltransferase involved in cell wall biosynthesis